LIRHCPLRLEASMRRCIRFSRVIKVATLEH
jgi:hypothetical protein